MFRSRWLAVWLVIALVPLPTIRAQDHEDDAVAPPEQATEPPQGLDAALALQEAFVEAVARAEPSIVSIACIRQPPDASMVRGGASNPFGNPAIEVREAAPIPLRAPDFRFDVELRENPFLAEGVLVPTGNLQQNPTPFDPDFIPNDYGSGVVVSADGLILTNYHVIADYLGPDELFVRLHDRRGFYAEIVAADPRSDLAVLRVPADDLVPITFGDTSVVRKGQFVLALGNPYALARDGSPSVSWGIISNIARAAAPAFEVEDSFGMSLGTERHRRDTIHHFGTLLQTDARLSMGTSGGALVNLRGEMIGLTTSVSALPGYEQSAGYAVPLDDTMRRAIATLMEGREVEYGFLGVAPTTVLPTEAARYNLPQPGGARVESVYAGFAGDRAQPEPLQREDVIIAVDGEPVYSAGDLVLAIGRLPPETEVTLDVYRGGMPQVFRVVLGKYPVREDVIGQVIATVRPEPWRGIRVDYPTISPETIANLSLETGLAFALQEGCVLVIGVEPNSPAEEAGIEVGMLITRVADRPVHSPRQFYETAAEQTGDVRVRLAAPGSATPRVVTLPAEQ